MIFGKIATRFDSKYAPYLVTAGAGLLFIGMSFFGYRWYVMHREKQAQLVFADCLYAYEKAQKDATQWPHVELLCKLGAEQQAHTNLAPFFTAYYAQALHNQGKTTEALEAMTSAMQKISSTSPMYPLYATKQACMLMDAGGDYAIQGLQLMQKLAHDTHNIQRDQALYYLGLHYWHEGNDEQARAAWQELQAFDSQDTLGKSAWASLAQEKLQAIA